MDGNCIRYEIVVQKLVIIDLCLTISNFKATNKLIISCLKASQ
jgi:hypothetical protein